VQFASENQLALSDLQDQKAAWKSALLKVRLQKKRPRLDDKIITSWNALLISGLVKAYMAFGDKMFLEEAEDIFGAVMNTNNSGNLLVHSSKDGIRQKENFVEDYAFMIDAALNLYEASMDVKYLEMAQQLTISAKKLFMEDNSGFFTNSDDDRLIVSTIKTNDGDLPSPNSVMARNFLRLGHLGYNREYLSTSRTMLSAMFPLLAVNPESYAGWGSLYLNEQLPYYEIAIVGDDAGDIVKDLQQHFLPNVLIAASPVQSELPLFKGRWIENTTYIYVCRDNVCKLPVTSVEAAIQQLLKF